MVRLTQNGTPWRIALAVSRVAGQRTPLQYGPKFENPNGDVAIFGALWNEDPLNKLKTACTSSVRL